MQRKSTIHGTGILKKLKRTKEDRNIAKGIDFAVLRS